MPVANDNCSNDTSIQVPKRKSEMRRLNRLALIVATFAILASVITTDSRADDKRAARILFVSQSAGFRHGSVTRKDDQLSVSERVMTELGISSNLFRVDCTQDVAKDFTIEKLKNYDIVMFYLSLIHI